MFKRWKVGRNTALLILGALLVGSQGIKSLVGQDVDNAVITAGVSILVSPLVLGRDEKQGK